MYTNFTKHQQQVIPFSLLTVTRVRQKASCHQGWDKGGSTSSQLKQIKDQTLTHCTIALRTNIQQMMPKFLHPEENSISRGEAQTSIQASIWCSCQNRCSPMSIMNNANRDIYPAAQVMDLKTHQPTHLPLLFQQNSDSPASHWKDNQ